MTNRQLCVFIGCVRRNDTVLLVQRSEKECPGAHLKWEIPGGKAEFGETPEEAVVREIREETGVEVKIAEMIPRIFTLYWNYDWGEQQTFVICYMCEFAREHSLQKKDHHVKKVRWVPLKQALRHDLIPGTKEIIEILTENPMKFTKKQSLLPNHPSDNT